MEGKFTNQDIAIDLVASLTSFLLTVTLLYQLAFWGKLPFNTYLGSINLGGLNKEAATRVLSEELSPSTEITFTTGTKSINLSLEELGISFEAAQTADLAFASAGTNVEPVYSVDDEKYNQALVKIEKELSSSPHDASVGFDERDKAYKQIDAVYGEKVLKDDFKNLAVPEIIATNNILPVPFKPIEPNIRTDEVSRAIDKANEWLKSEINIEIKDKTKVLDQETIKKGIVFVATDKVDVEFNDEEIVSDLDKLTDGVDLGSKLLDKSKLSKDIAESIKGDKKPVVVSLYEPAKVSASVSVRSSQVSQTTSSSASTGNFITPPGNHDPGGPGRTVGYSIRVEEGLSIDATDFANAVSDIIDNDLSWRGSGKLHFARYETGGFLLYLASPSTVDRLCYPLSTNGFTSCRVGSRVIINSDRWFYSSPYFTGSLPQYRQYVINHEVGHMIGNGHHPCPGSGVAPVMHQQTLGMNGCEPGPWPLDWELAGVN